MPTANKFFGKTLGQRHNGPFRVTETSYSPNTKLAVHRHDTAYLSFLLAGAYLEFSGSRETTCTAGTVIWHPPNTTHGDRFQSLGGHLLNLEISDAWLQDVAQELELAMNVRAFYGGLPYSLGLRLYHDLQANTHTVEEIATELAGFFSTDPPIDNRPFGSGGPLTLSAKPLNVTYH